MVLKLGHFEIKIINTWKGLKCATGEEWRRSVRTDHVRYIESRKRGICYVQQDEGRPIGSAHLE